MAPSLTIALAGNPNSGKTTMFNALTGARQRVGNYPGVTVAKREGRLDYQRRKLSVVDLPGMYSLIAYGDDELAARTFLLDERPHAVVDVMDAGALERSLYLSIQFLELGVPLVLALNMMDEVEKRGCTLDSKLLSKLLGVPVVETVARNNVGMEALVQEAVETAEKHKGDWTPFSISYGADIDAALLRMTGLIEENRFLAEKYPARWLALKYLEGDEQIIAIGRRAGGIAEKLEAIAAETSRHIQETTGTYPDVVISDHRYGYIASLLKQGVVRTNATADRIRFSDKVDRVLTHSLLGPLVMLAVLYLMFQVTFIVGEYPMGWLESFFGWLNETVMATMPEGLLRSLIVSGVIDGVGGVLGFVPLIVIMFFQLSFLEDLGYTARMAYMLDRVFRAFGLHGGSVMPFIISGGIPGGCAVPGVMASRTLRSPKERLATILTAPFMACGAKIPVFLLLVAAFFPQSAGMAMFWITLGSWAAALLVGKLLRSTVIRGRSTPFIMELPPYRLPTLKGLCIHTFERAWQYIRKAGTVILAISILMWAAMTLPGLPEERVAEFDAQRAAVTQELETVQAQEAAVAATENDAAVAASAPDAAEAAESGEVVAAAPAEESAAVAEEGTEEPARSEAVTALEDQLAAIDNTQAEEALRYSVAGRIGSGLESVSRYAGFDWRVNIALIGGIAAKEIIVSTLGTAYALGEVDPEDTASLSDKLAGDPGFSPLVAISLIVFTILYAPCFVTVVAMAKEASWKWAGLAVAWNTTLGFAMAVLVYQVGRMFV